METASSIYFDTPYPQSGILAQNSGVDFGPGEKREQHAGELRQEVDPGGRRQAEHSEWVTILAAMAAEISPGGVPPALPS
jgi:hypothetical protein